jgi:hypothetical protein
MDAFFAFKQLASVDDYAHKFEEHMHKILVYNHSYDETLFVNRFIEGLKPEIRSVIQLHQPSTVDLAFSLAQTQEALLVEDTMISSKKYEYKNKYTKTFQQHGILGNFAADKPAENKVQAPILLRIPLRTLTNKTLIMITS